MTQHNTHTFESFVNQVTNRDALRTSESALDMLEPPEDLMHTVNPIFDWLDEYHALSNDLNTKINTQMRSILDDYPDVVAIGWGTTSHDRHSDTWNQPDFGQLGTIITQHPRDETILVDCVGHAAGDHLQLITAAISAETYGLISQQDTAFSMIWTREDTEPINMILANEAIGPMSPIALSIIRSLDNEQHTLSQTTPPQPNWLPTTPTPGVDIEP
jgi:hypothetical protein